MRLRTIMTIVFCISAIAPLAIFWLWPQTRVLDSEMQNAKERHIVIADNLAVTLNRYYSDVVKTFDYFVEDFASVKNTTPRADLLSHLNFKHICMVNIDTKKVVRAVNSSNYSCPISIGRDEMGWLKAQLEGTFEQTIVTGVRKSVDSDNVIYALHRNENSIYVGTISTQYLLKIGSQVSFGSKGHAVIMDKDGKALYHPVSEWTKGRADLGNINIVKRLYGGETGVDVFYSPAMKEDVLAGFTIAKEAGWGVIIGQPVEEIFDRVSEVKNTALVVMGIGFFIALGLAYFASKILTHPIEEMVKSMRRIGNGELWAHEKMTEGRFQPKEFSDARDSIKTMAEKLQENIDTISRHAYLDGVTGLPNRECFRVLAQEEIEKLSISGNSGALLFLDLDGFKQVNDVYGHRAGDDLLLAFSQRLHKHCGIFMKRYARGVDNALTVLPARLGGDEFVVFLGNITGPETTSEFTEQLFSKVFGKFSLHNGVNLDISGSVGGAIFPTQAGDFDELLRLADIAMYEAKNSGKGRYCLHKDVDDYFDNITTSDKLEDA